MRMGDHRRRSMSVPAFHQFRRRHATRILRLSSPGLEKAGLNSQSTLRVELTSLNQVCLLLSRVVEIDLLLKAMRYNHATFNVTRLFGYRAAIICVLLDLRTTAELDHQETNYGSRLVEQLTSLATQVCVLCSLATKPGERLRRRNPRRKPASRVVAATIRPARQRRQRRTQFHRQALRRSPSLAHHHPLPEARYVRESRRVGPS